MSAVPLLILGGAAVLLLGGKKKKKSSKSTTLSGYSAVSAAAAYSPPVLPSTTKKKGSGYSNVSREKMQWIQTTLASLNYDVGPSGMDGLYGPNTKAAVWDFQEDHQDVLGAPDGKPGPNTQARLAEVQRARGQAQDQGEYPQDECDPLDPSAWGSGNMCVMKDGRWVTMPMASPSISGDVDIAWLPDNMKVVKFDFTQDEIVYEPDAYGRKRYAIGVYIPSSANDAVYNNYLSAVKYLAEKYTDINFYMAGTGLGSQGIRMVRATDDNAAGILNPHPPGGWMANVPMTTKTFYRAKGHLNMGLFLFGEHPTPGDFVEAVEDEVDTYLYKAKESWPNLDF